MTLEELRDIYASAFDEDDIRSFIRECRSRYMTEGDANSGKMYLQAIRDMRDILEKLSNETDEGRLFRMKIEDAIRRKRAQLDLFGEDSGNRAVN